VGVDRGQWITDLTKIDLEVLDWIDLARCRNMWRDLVNVVINLRVPSIIKTTIRSSRTLFQGVKLLDVKYYKYEIKNFLGYTF
jgi:RNA-binding protein YlmH